MFAGCAIGAPALALVVITKPPYSEEVWLNTITSKSHIMLAVAVILAAIPGTGCVAWLQGAVLLLAPLSGPGGAMLLPLFVLRGWLDRSPQRLLQALLLLPGVLVQIVTVLAHPEPARTVGVNLPIVLASITGKQILLPLLGIDEASVLSQARTPRSPRGGFCRGRGCTCGRVRDAPPCGLAQSKCGDQVAVRGIHGYHGVSYFRALTPGGSLDLLFVGFSNRYYIAPAALTGLVVLGVAFTGTELPGMPPW